VSFSQAAQSVEKMLPSNMNVTDVFAGTLGAGTAQQALLAGVNSGKLLVNYNGHGSVEIWGSGLLNDSLASSLTNGTKLPMFVAMNCLNGFFHDVYTQSLATALMLSPNGGAVSVWASSGLTEPGPQFQMDQAFARALFTQPGMAVGDAVLRAKSGIEDSDVRKTFILFGDPMMRLKSAADMSAGGGKVPGLGDLPVIHPPLRDPRAGREME
jgi:Peptidase family C25